MTKLLFTNDGRNTYVLAEGDSLTEVDYNFYEAEPKMSFGTKSSLKGLLDWDRLVIRGKSLRRQKLSFAMESFWGENRNHSESLKPFIDYASRGVIMRELTGEESEKLDQFKKKEKREFFK